MKKILIVAALMLGLAVAASAQPKAIGIRGGFGVELSYQQYAGGANFVELDLGLNTFNALNLAGTYNFSLAQFGNGFNFFAGPGVALGLGFNPGWFNVGIAGQVGIEYTFNFPLQLSLDLRPQLGLHLQDGASGFGFWGWYPNLGIRYAF